MALEKALQEGKVTNVNIYPDSSFCYYVVHRDSGTLPRNKCKTAIGGPTKHEEVIKNILRALGGPGNCEQVAELTISKVATLFQVVEEKDQDIRPPSVSGAPRKCFLQQTDKNCGKNMGPQSHIWR